MKKISISKNCIESSQAVFGTWALGGGYWGPQEHSDSVKAIHAAIRGGINHFDTAPVYGKGKSELLIGQQLRKEREKYIIATKCFYKEPEQFEKSIKQSLKRLNTKYIDIFYIHWPAGHTDMRPVMALLEKYRQQGIIRAVGVSNFSLEQLKNVMEAGTVDIFQCGYNLLWRKEENELLPFCKNNGITTAAYSILAQGILTGKYSTIPENKEFIHRKKMLLFEETIFPSVIKEIHLLKKIAEKYQINCSKAAIFWTKENELIDCSILGCRNRKQTEENLKPFSIQGNPDMLKKLGELSERIIPLLPNEENLFRHKT